MYSHLSTPTDWHQRRYRHPLGFTVLELLIALAVVGVLAGLVLARVQTVKTKAYRAALLNDLRHYGSAQESYLASTGAYATAPAALPGFALSDAVVVDTSASTATAWYLQIRHTKGDSLVCASARGYDSQSDGRLDCSASGVAGLADGVPHDNLLVNGSLELRSTGGFVPAYGTITYDPTLAVPGTFGSLRSGPGSANISTTPSIPLDTLATYELSADMRYAGTMAVYYAGVVPVDSDGRQIGSLHFVRVAGTTTTLAAPLAPGDLTVTVASAANWHNGSDASSRILSVGNYVTGDGRNWGADYTQHAWRGAGSGSAWAPGAINTTTNVITLSAPWPAAMANPANGGVWPVGTPVWNGYSNLFFPWCLARGTNTRPAGAWTRLTVTMAGALNRSGTYQPCAFPAGAARFKLVFYNDYGNQGATVWLTRLLVRRR